MTEKHHVTFADSVNDVPKCFPAAMRAQKVGKRAAKGGMDFATVEAAAERLQQELAEFSEAYKAGDKAYLEKAANVILPEAIAAFDKMYELYKADWKRDYKILDIMMYTHDFGGARLRMLDAVETINDYLNGKTDCIEELEAEIISGINKSWQTPKNYISNFE
jgi:hypothetical protein